MKRIYQTLITDHFRKYRQMLFLMGPRQVGKTTLSLALQNGWTLHYFNWDDENHRKLILQGPKAISEYCGLQHLSKKIPLLIFDEIHKYAKWKLFLKGLYDSYPKQAHILITGSARLDVYKKGGDSLMGRYFFFRCHPLSVGELLYRTPPEFDIREKPKKINDELFKKLWTFGGFPDPFLHADIRYFNRWKRLRFHQLFREDIRDLSRIQELGQLEILSKILSESAGCQVSYNSLANQLQVSDKTVRTWLKILKSLYFSFEVRPWSKNIKRSLLKEPKYFLWDWSLCKDEGQKAENFIASHLLKAVDLWTDSGLGEYRLHYLRDKMKREVDFVVVKNEKPWMLVEVKRSLNKGVSPDLHYFQKMTGAPFAMQVVIDMPYVDRNCFIEGSPIIVPAKTFLSQLV